MLFLSLNTIKKKLLTFFYVQLFITLLSLPILLCWGLPFSPMTFVGNLIFAPFLSLFLLLSALFFFTQLLHIPNSVIVYGLELFSALWSRCLEWSSSSWLMTFVQPSIVVLILIISSALLIVQLAISNETKTLFLATLLLSTTCYLFYCGPPSFYYESITHRNGQITIARVNNTTILIDNNCIAQASDSWLEYTLVKELRRRLGSCTIHHLILLQPSVRLLKNMHHLQSLLHLESVYLPTWEGALKKHQWRYFFDLKRSLSTHSGMLIRVQHPCMISLEEGSYLMIEPQKTVLKTGAISYQAIKVYGCLNQREVSILSEKAFTKK